MMGAELDPCSSFILYTTQLFFPHTHRKGGTPYTKVQDLASPGEGYNGQTDTRPPAGTRHVSPRGRNSLFVAWVPSLGTKARER